MVTEFLILGDCRVTGRRMHTTRPGYLMRTMGPLLDDRTDQAKTSDAVYGEAYLYGFSTCDLEAEQVRHVFSSPQ